MCNYPHKYSRKVKRTRGEGYKLLTWSLRGAFSECSYLGYEDDWIKWKYKDNGGFCVIPNKKEARRLLKHLRKDRGTLMGLRIVGVEYQRAFCRHFEDKITMGKKYDTILVKQFRFVIRREG